MGIFLFLVALWSAFGVVGYFIARSRSRDPQSGCLWGIFLGPIGWLVVAFSENVVPMAKVSDGRSLRKCPNCAEMVLMEAKVCRYCQRELPILEQPAPARATLPPPKRPWRTEEKIMLGIFAAFAAVIILLAIFRLG